jgi:hypothetical protein
MHMFSGDRFLSARYVVRLSPIVKRLLAVVVRTLALPVVRLILCGDGFRVARGSVLALEVHHAREAGVRFAVHFHPAAYHEASAAAPHPACGHLLPEAEKGASARALCAAFRNEFGLGFFRNAIAFPI